jgi:hypothetical protein
VTIVEKKYLQSSTLQAIFIYLNKKQNSKSSIALYQRHKANNLDNSISSINKITQDVLHAQTTTSFAKAIANHEAEMSRVLEIKPSKKLCLAISKVK